MAAKARAELFTETAGRKGLPEAIIEKDFWVCWVLKQLFSIEALSGRLLFKGGTSLSKIFHAINRFSEDIDLAVDYAALLLPGPSSAKDQRAAAITRKMCAPYFLTIPAPMPCTANNSASFLGAVAAMVSSARSPKIRNAGTLLRLASPKRHERSACSIRR